MPFWSRRKPTQTPAETARELRTQALRRSAEQIGIGASPAHPSVFGLLMETGYPHAVASLVVFADGSTSLYFSTGGGVTGAGEHASVRDTHPALFTEAEAQREAFTPTVDTPLPQPGRVRFYLRTFGGTLMAEASEEDLGQMHHRLSRLFHAGHAVIAAIRRATGGNGAT